MSNSCIIASMNAQDARPIAYQRGYIEFYKLRFKVTPDVLIPRPETELLVEEVLNFARNYTPPKPYPLTILDIGTGSGNIAISLAKNLNVHPRGGHSNIIATDVSEKALKVAKQNAKLHEVLDKIQFVKSDLLSNVPRPASPAGGPPEDICVIVTNLPYIPSQRIPYLDSSVKDFEPHLALDGGPDGFELYRKLFAQIDKQLPKFQPKLALCEIDYTHGELAVSEASKYFPNSRVEVKTDLARKLRILKIKF